MDYTRENINGQWTVPSGYVTGDYCQIHTNDGVPESNDYDADWDDPADKRKLSLFPANSGKFGFGRQTWGHFRFGGEECRGSTGWGYWPFGHFDFGLGSMILRWSVTLADPGLWRAGLAAYDVLGNEYAGAPDTDEIVVDLIPLEPDPPIPYSYDSATDTLVLTL